MNDEDVMVALMVLMAASLVGFAIIARLLYMWYNGG